MFGYVACVRSVVVPSVVLPRLGSTQTELEEKRLLGRPRRRWEDNIRMDLQEVECGGMDWIGLAQDRDRWRAILNAVMNLRVQ
jgi:hypothetical protein